MADDSHDTPADRFWRLWQQAPPPDLRRFLDQAGPLAAPELLGVLRVDQHQRWRRGERVQAEAYLADLSADPAAGSQALDLVYQEFLLREQRGEVPDLEEFAARFPHLADALRLQVAVRRALQDQAAPAAWPDVPGVTIEGELGRGGMGVVLRGRDRHLDRPLAVKVLRSAADADRIRRFVAEARLTGQLQHPGIVPIHALGDLPVGGPYFTMKLVQGRTLAEVLAGRTAERTAGVNPAARPGADEPPGLPRRSVLPHLLKLFEQVCQAVAYAHAQGVIHRDLKPQNVMVGAFGEVQVMDWGLAKRCGEPADAPVLEAPPAESPPVAGPESTVDDQPRPDTAPEGTQAGTVLGTPAYLPPEQARGEVARLDPRADVFALGAILCEILTGKPPYPGPTAADALRQAAAGDLRDAHQRLDGCGADADLIALAKACLAADPQQRPRDGEAVATAMTAHLTGVQERLQAAEVARAAAAERLEGERRARRLVSVGAGLGAAAAVVTAALAWWALVEKGQADTQTALAEGRAVALTQKNEELAVAEAEERTARDLAQGVIERMTSPAALAYLEKVRPEELRPEQRDFLSQAVAYYRQATARAAPTPEARLRQARGFAQMGNLYARLGQRAETEAAYRAAQEAYGQLAAADPDVAEYQAGLAASWLNLGNLAQTAGRMAEAERCYVTARDLHARVADRRPQEAFPRRELAGVWHNLGAVASATGRLADAEQNYVRARDLQARLAAEEPANAEYRQELATTWMSLGLLQQRANRLADAEQSLQAARDLLAPLADDPKAAAARAALAGVANVLGLVQAGGGRTDAAARSYATSRELGERLVTDFPHVPDYARSLAGTLNNLGWLQEVADHPGVPDLAIQLARVCNARGVMQEAAGRITAAEGHYQEALRLRERLHAALPLYPELAVSLGGSACNLGNLRLRQGRPVEALALYDRALKTLGPVLRGRPPDPQARQFACNTHVGRAQSLEGLGRFAEAAADWQAAAALNDAPARAAHLRQGLAGARLAAGLTQDYAWPLLWGRPLW